MYESGLFCIYDFSVITDNHTDMACINDSIQELTASLQELAATEKAAKNYTAITGFEENHFSEVPEAVQDFLQKSRAHAERTKDVSVGIY